RRRNPWHPSPWGRRAQTPSPQPSPPEDGGRGGRNSDPPRPPSSGGEGPGVRGSLRHTPAPRIGPTSIPEARIAPSPILVVDVPRLVDLARLVDAAAAGLADVLQGARELFLGRARPGRGGPGAPGAAGS